MTIINFYKKYFYENFDKYPEGYDYDIGHARIVKRVDSIGKVLELYDGGILLDEHGYAGYKMSNIEGFYFEFWYDGDDTENSVVVSLSLYKGDVNKLVRFYLGDAYPSWNPYVRVYSDDVGYLRNFRCVMVNASFIALLVTGRAVYVYADSVYDEDNQTYITEERKWVELVPVDVDFCKNVVFELQLRKVHFDEICHGAFAWSPEEAFVRGLIDAINQLLPILLVLLFIVILIEVIR